MAILVLIDLYITLQFILQEDTKVQTIWDLIPY